MRLAGKKIIYLVTQSKYGGAQKYILQLARHFSEQNEVVIACGEKDSRDKLFFSELERLGIRTIALDNLIRGISLVKAIDAVFEIRKMLTRERPDILHINSSMAGAVGSLAAWLYRFDPLNKAIRVVYTAHGFVFNEPLSPLRKKMYLFIERISAYWKGAIITVSEADRQSGLAHRIAPPGRMITIHNGIDLSLSFLDRSEARKYLKLPHDAFIVGTIASLYATKGLTHLINAASRIRSDAFLCTIIGDGPNRVALERHIQALKLNEKVLLLGAVPHAARYLKAFDLFVLPSVKEGLPYTLLEAGLAGVPVIATRTGGMPEIIENGTSGLLVEPANATALGDTLRSLMTDTSPGVRFAKNLKEKISREFSEAAMLAKTEELYLKLSPATPPPSAI